MSVLWVCNGMVKSGSSWLAKIMNIAATDIFNANDSQELQSKEELLVGWVWVHNDVENEGKAKLW